MKLSKRQKIYKAIEDYRGRPLIVYVTSTRQGIPAQITGDAVREFIDQIDLISDSDEEVDVLVHSTGGDALTAWKLMSILRERFKKVYVLVPYMAFSAATLFALGGDEIIMHPHASLGPIDPQMTVFQPDKAPRHFAYEDVGAFLRFLSSEVKISEQVHLSAIIEKLFSAVDPVNIGAAKRASELSSSIGERLLLLHMTEAEEKPKAREIAENLNKSFFDHADAVSRSRAKELKLRVAKSDEELEAFIWNAYLGIEEYMEFRQPFNALHLYSKDPRVAELVRPLPPLRLPQNTPNSILLNTWENLAQQAINRCLSEKAIEVDFSVTSAIVESLRSASEFRISGTLTASLDPYGNPGVSITETDFGWKPTDEIKA